VLLHLPLFLLPPPAGAAALVLGLVLLAWGRALSRRWARQELLDQVEQAKEPWKPEQQGEDIQRPSITAQIADEMGSLTWPSR
jgi:hypothetical protein